MQPELPPRSASSALRRRALLIVLSAGLALLFVAAIELGLRVTELAVPSLRSLPLPGELSGVLQADELLFWTLRPSAQMRYHEVTVTTNRLGLRSPEVGAREPGELRILLVGESGAFGIGVEDGETYAARLERILQQDRPLRVRVLNASVPAWSSFQGLKYLELRGLALEPDVVLFSFEANDYLPASLRDSSTTEAEAVRSDRQLFHSRHGAAWRRLIQRSALFRFVSYRIAGWQIQRFRERGQFVSPEEIGVPVIDVTPRLRRAGPGRFGLSDVPEDRLPTRVLPEERRPILEELLALTRSHGASLVLIHPTYQTSARHECLITRFAAERNVPLFEAWDAVHGSGVPRAETFLDFGHPSARGHELLAEGLARFLVERGVLEKR